MSSDPMEERRLRLEQAEREAAGDFTRTAASIAKEKADKIAAANVAKDDSWQKYKGSRDDDDDSNPNNMLNKQHRNLKAQAKIDLAMGALLDTSLPRQER